MNVQQFRKRPVEIEAIQLTKENVRAVRAFCPEALWWCCGSTDCGDYPALRIFTLEGEHKATPGDWIIKGIKGEFYPCKPDIFKLTYEPINKENANAKA